VIRLTRAGGARQLMSSSAALPALAPVLAFNKLSDHLTVRGARSGGRF